MSRYLRILRRRRAVVPFTAAVIARLPVSMAPLGLILLIQSVRGSYAVAGMVTAALALGSAFAAPGWGRLMDRTTQPAVLMSTGVVSSLLLAALAISADAGAGDGVLIVLAAATGATIPVVTPAMRAAWRVILSAPEELAAAYAMDAVAVETIFIVGPMLLSALLVTTPRAVPLLVTAVLQAAGTLVYGTASGVRAWRPPAASTTVAGSSPLRARGVGAVLLVALAMAVGFGHLDVAIAATAREILHEPSRVGLLYAAVSGGSVAGGLWYGGRYWPGEPRRRLPVVLGWFATGLFLLPQVVAHGAAMWLLLMLLLATGLSIAPGLIIQQALVDGLAPAHRLGEAQAWLHTAIAGGAAAGMALAGVLADLGGPRLSFLGAGVAVSSAALVAAGSQRRWRVPDQGRVA